MCVAMIIFSFTSSRLFYYLIKFFVFFLLIDYIILIFYKHINIVVTKNKSYKNKFNHFGIYYYFLFCKYM